MSNEPNHTEHVARHLAHAERYGRIAINQIGFAVGLAHMGTSDAWVDDVYRSARLAARHALATIEVGVTRG